METAAVVLLVLLSPDDAAGETAAMLESVVHQEIGAITSATVADIPAARRAWQTPAGVLRAKYVGRVTWQDPTHARVELSFSAQSLAASRDVSFRARDSRYERGRTLGLVLVSMLRGIPGEPWSDEKPTVAPATAPPAHDSSLAAFGVGERAAAGNIALGPGVAVSLAVLPWLHVQPFFAMEWGDEQSYSNLAFGVGARFEPFHWRSGLFNLGFRVRAELNRESADYAETTIRGTPDNDLYDFFPVTVGKTKSLWNPGLGAEVQGRIQLGTRASLFVSGGLRWLARKFSVTDNPSFGVKTTTDYATFRPGAILGLSLSL